MDLLEKYATRLRHYPGLRSLPIWSLMRVCFLRFYWGRGIERILNGSVSIRLDPRLRTVSESYEVPVWHDLISNVREGDLVVDVGAYIGLYTIPLAKRAGANGRVIAFEPDPESRGWLSRNVSLNRLSERVEIHAEALGATKKEILFCGGEGPLSQINPDVPGEMRVKMLTLDEVISGRAVDYMKIDVEGYEGEVLQGAARLMRDPARYPRKIYVEVHPDNWKRHGWSDRRLLDLLAECGYRVTTIAGSPVEEIKLYGEIVAGKERARPIP